MTLSKQLALALALTLVALPACGGGEELGRCDAELDSDSDGLDNCVELALGTAPHLADTDGDGISDFDEVIRYAYATDENAGTFYPLVANTPTAR